jgi:hypothetical protein
LAEAAENPGAQVADRDTATPAGPEAARFTIRSAAYCVLCDRMVECRPDGTCPDGHPANALSGAIPLGAADPVPQLPRFNIAAFALPPVWGPAHGQWVGAIFLPIWLFADSAIAAASRGGIARIGAVAVGVLTVAFQAFFAKRANGVAWRRVSDRMGIDLFVKRERVWALVCVPLGLLMLGWAFYYRLALA